MKASRTAVARRCEEVQTNSVHSNGLAAFPKKRRLADFSAPAALGNIHGPSERHTAECHEPRSTNSFSKIAWPITSVSTSIASGGQLITGVYPSRGLIHGSPQTPQVMQSPALSAVYATEPLPCKPSITRRQQEASSTHCVAEGSANISAPAVKANTSRPLSAQPGLRSAGGPVSRSRGSAASMSAVTTESPSYVWPAAPGGLSRFIDPSTGPAIKDTASIAPKAEKEETDLPVKGPPLRLGLSEWGLPYAITQVRMPIHPLAKGAPCPTGVVLCFHFYLRTATWSCSAVQHNHRGQPCESWLSAGICREGRQRDVSLAGSCAGVRRGWQQSCLLCPHIWREVSGSGGAHASETAGHSKAWCQVQA